MLVALLMPLWTFINAQLAILRAGGDTKVCMRADGCTPLLAVPALILQAAFTHWSAIALYLAVKLFDVGKVLIAHRALKKERWVVNLSADRMIQPCGRIPS